jgi:hypothetical protein
LLGDDRFFLSQNYPNPVAILTTIQYSLPKACEVAIKLYDVYGRQVAILVNESQEAGCYQINLDCRSVAEKPLANGIYFYRLQTGDFVKTRKLLVIR